MILEQRHGTREGLRHKILSFTYNRRENQFIYVSYHHTESDRHIRAGCRFPIVHLQQQQKKCNDITFDAVPLLVLVALKMTFE